MRHLHLLVAAVGLSSLGDRVALVPLALLVEPHGGLAVAALFVAMWSPAALLAGPAGLVADLWSPRRLLIVSSLAAAALSAGAGDGRRARADAGAGRAAWAAVNAIAMPAEFALLPLVAGEGGIARANGQVEFARYAGFILGPALGGLLAAVEGTTGALLANAGTFLVLAARRGRDPGRVAPARARRGTSACARGSCSSPATPSCAPVTGVVFVSLLLMTATPAAALFFADGDLHMGEAGYGILMAVWGAGMAIGAFAVAPRAKAGVMACGAVAAVGAQGLGIAVPALWPAVWLALAGYLFGGVAHGTKNVLARTLIHVRAPARLHGRAFAAFNGLRNGAELVALTLGGVAISELGARWTLLYAGGVPLLAALVALVWMRARVRVALAAQVAPRA